MEHLNIIPNRYIDYSSVKPISELKEGEIATIHATINSVKNIFTKRGMRMQIGSVSDDTGKISVVWFNQPFLIKALYPGKRVSLAGKVTTFSGRLSLTSPEYELLYEDRDTVHTGKLVPVYPETKFVTTKAIRRKIKREFDQVDFKDCLPLEVLRKYKITDLKSAYTFVHFPKDIKEVKIGKKRLAFNELLFLQLQALRKKLRFEKNKAVKMKIDNSIVEKFVKDLPFKLTGSQKIVIGEILDDMQAPSPMNRLLEGDVGSGKTVVAALASLVVHTNGYQTIFMAPTQILAQQHHETLQKLLPKLQISLITTNTKVPSTNNHIYVGTHALLHKKLNFSKVALVVIDEQHRFGVEQRRKLIDLSQHPHVLTMTATPIPRTIAQVAYGDLDISILTDMPYGRQKIMTWIVPEQKRQKAYDWIRSQITDNRSQVFIVCPLIDESSSETLKDVKNVTAEFLNLKSIFINQTIGLLHGRMKTKEKDKVLNDFRSGKLDVLVATPVVEVGIDIPNAAIMVIEAAERFGLAQLHQLRGRVGRSDKKSCCLLFSNIKYSKRLKAMTKTHSGFELAELDLKLRGPGEIFGISQSGFPELQVASWSDSMLVKQTKSLALKILKNQKTFPDIVAKLKTSN